MCVSNQELRIRCRRGLSGGVSCWVSHVSQNLSQRSLFKMGGLIGSPEMLKTIGSLQQWELPMLSVKLGFLEQSNLFLRFEPLVTRSCLSEPYRSGSTDSNLNFKLGLITLI